jgi:hypothetical protein
MEAARKALTVMTSYKNMEKSSICLSLSHRDRKPSHRKDKMENVFNFVPAQIQLGEI